jgi:hypothetical protein
MHIYAKFQMTQYIRDRGACLKVREGGGQDSTGAIPRRQAGFYLVVFYYPPKKWGGGHGPRLPPVSRSLNMEAQQHCLKNV